ncbi:exonuclease SbcD [Oikeobacillus pervagus]|uniref:Nuclease SbcCD subunit D n=1 Tax=Oikeobacillus pervagus TaxID=1325931 RepID=A0AAJ1T0Q2_9BACI|nr:exonuclease SbcCD subunit D [Oikeobacillus pervagus]MDQ0214657.1 exonuclease SbcD [Oikeobacillus pervagus]
MKFIHTADWHLGKLVHGIYMTTQQREVLQQFVKLVEEERPDAVIIAGDLYDRSVPPVEAVELLNEMLFTINVELKTPIVAISGNHDSAERLSFGASWFQHSRFYLKGGLTNDFSPVNINGVNFYLIPYAEPGIVRELLDDESIHSHEEAMKAMVGKIEKQLNPNEANVLVGHAFVLGGTTSDSERILSVGGSGCVPSDVFSPFDYTALGHLHSPDAIKHKTIRYSGSLLKYSFSEAKQRKSVSIIEMDEKGNFSLKEHSLTPSLDMREIEAFLDELLDPAFYQQQNTEDYIKVILKDEGAIVDPMGKLRKVYPNILHLERKIEAIDLRKKQSYQTVRDEKKSDLDLFTHFYEQMTSQSFSSEKREIMKNVMDKVKLEAESR